MKILYEANSIQVKLKSKLKMNLKNENAKQNKIEKIKFFYIKNENFKKKK